LKITIRDAVPEDAENVIAHLREYDMKKLQSCGDTERVLRLTIERATECYLGFIDDEPICIMFVQATNICAGKARVGILMMRGADEHTNVVGRYSIRLFRMFIRRYEELTGEIDPEYTRSVQWMQRLGFTIEGNTFYWRRD